MAGFKGSLGLKIEDAALRQNLESVLKDYDLHYSDELDPAKYSSFLADTSGLLKLDQQGLRKNLFLPVLCLQQSPIQNLDMLIKRNVFRIVSYANTLEQIVEHPAKDDTKRKFVEVVEFGQNVRNYMMAHEILKNPPDIMSKWIDDEVHFTSNGDYGVDEKLWSKFKQIRGQKRLISRIEAAYQALQIRELLDYKRREESPILVVSKSPGRLDELVAELNKNKYSVEKVDSLLEAFKKLDKRDYAMLISEFRNDEHLLLSTIQQNMPELTIMLLANNQQIPMLLNNKFLPPKGYVFPTKTEFGLLANAVNSIAEDYAEHKQLRQYAPFKNLLPLLSKYPNPEKGLYLDALHRLLRNEKDRWGWATQALKHMFDSRGPGKKLRDNLLVVCCYNLRKGTEDFKRIGNVSTDVVCSFDKELPAEMFMGKISFKRFSSKRRGYVEQASFEHLSEQNKFVRESLRSENDPLAAIYQNFPIINTPKVIIKPIEYQDAIVLATQYIEGPTLDELAKPLNEKIKAGDFGALGFKRRAIFELNNYLAFLQHNPILLPKEVEIEHTNFAKIAKKTLVDNLQFFETKANLEKEDCAAGYLDVLLAKINSEPEQVSQYFDFHWSNVIFDVGDDKMSLDNILEIYKKEGASEFMKKRLFKRDFNKVYRTTRSTEDCRHNSPFADIPAEEQEIYDMHFLLNREKYRLLREAQTDLSANILGKANKVGAYQESIKEVSDLIAKIETDSLNQEDRSKLNEVLSKEREIFYSDADYVDFYRNMRSFDYYLRRNLAKAAKELKYSRKRKDYALEGAKSAAELSAKIHLKRAEDSLSRIISNYSGEKFQNGSDEQFVPKAAQNLKSILETMQKSSIDYSRLIANYSQEEKERHLL